MIEKTLFWALIFTMIVLGSAALQYFSVGLRPMFLGCALQLEEIKLSRMGGGSEVGEVKRKYALVIRQILLVLLPLLICILIPLLWLVYYYSTAGTLHKEINFILKDFPLQALGDSPPFIVLSIYAYCLIRKHRCNREIVIKVAIMLTPITLFSFYWYAKYTLSPLALGFLPFINLLILVPAWLIGIVANNANKDTKN